MKYLTAVDDFFPERQGGSARVAWDVACLMRDRGHEVTLVCKNRGRTDGLRVRIGVEHGIRVIRIPWDSGPRWWPFRYASTIRTAADAIRRSIGGERWDVIHVHLPLIGTAVADVFPECPRFVYTMHSPVTMEMAYTWEHGGMLGWLKRTVGLEQLNQIEGSIIRRCDVIQTLSHYTKERLEAIHGEKFPVRVIPHWVDGTFTRRRTREEAKRLLGWPQHLPALFTVRKHIPRTGLEVAIDAIAGSAKAERCFFAIGGDGFLRPELEHRATSLGATSEQVKFMGRLSEEELHLAYEAADLFILPSAALECFGLITIEAMASGCPVLGSDLAANPELIAPMSPELLFRGNDVASLMEKVELFLNGKLPIPSSEDLVEYVYLNFSVPAVMPQILDLIGGPVLRACA